jgi:hypothetical protein
MPTHDGPPPIRIPVSETMLRTAQRFASAACIGGNSSVREDADRLERLMEDQTVGQLGQMALAIWKDGHMGEYLIQRAAANAYPTQGDGGADFVGSNIDVKTSLMRASYDPLSYRLPVRPAEMHDGWVYVLALVEPFMVGVVLVGFAVSSDLMARGMATEGTFAGAYVLPATELRPLPPLEWRGRWGLT